LLLQVDLDGVGSDSAQAAAAKDDKKEKSKHGESYAYIRVLQGRTSRARAGEGMLLLDGRKEPLEPLRGSANESRAGGASVRPSC
jgi:hypothetical protein